VGEGARKWKQILRLSGSWFVRRVRRDMGMIWVESLLLLGDGKLDGRIKVVESSHVRMRSIQGAS
jgi:hypothetical protein